jgi:hypothetical protein
MFKLTELRPTKKERRELFLGVCKGLLVALIVSFVALVVPAFREWIGALAKGLLAFGASDVPIRGWTIIAGAVCLSIAGIRLFRWIIRRSPEARLFRSLTREEQKVVRLLAKADYGLTEGELCTHVPVSTQTFLRLIDRLVNDLR